MKSTLHIQSTAANPWTFAPEARENGVGGDVLAAFDPDKPLQTMDGFGGCFNELGWKALQKTSAAAREEVMRLLFDPEDGCRFDHCRMPIGANDFATSWYSHNENRDDYDMQLFSIERDHESLIPFIQMARSIFPGLRIWASPWCPPTWMKKSGIYACHTMNANWGQTQGSDNSDIAADSCIRNEPRILEAYARYFVRFLQAYAETGIPIYAIHPQNEVAAEQIFPSCVWDANVLADFIAEYLRPAFAEAALNTEIWFGTMNTNDPAYADRVLSDPRLRDDLPGAGFQWAAKDMLPKLRRRTDLKIMQTESECHNGSNSWESAERTFGLVNTYVSGGAGSYMYWNLVLDQWGVSTWGWRQNSLVSIHNTTGSVKINPELHVMRHFSGVVDVGARFLGSVQKGPAEALGFANPNGRFVIVAANTGDAEHEVGFQLDGQRFTTSLPPHSFHSFVFAP